MTINGWIQVLIYCALVTALVLPLGWYMTRVFNGERTFLSPVLRPVEAALYWAGGVDEKREQHWLTYAIAMLLFNAAGFLLLYAMCLVATAVAFLLKVKVRKLGMKGMIIAAFCGLAVLALLIVGWNCVAV